MWTPAVWFFRMTGRKSPLCRFVCNFVPEAVENRLKPDEPSGNHGNSIGPFPVLMSRRPSGLPEGEPWLL
jgi:hypothetical protein